MVKTAKTAGKNNVQYWCHIYCNVLLVNWHSDPITLVDGGTSMGQSDSVWLPMGCSFQISTPLAKKYGIHYCCPQE